MFGQTYITLNTPLGRSAEVDIPSSPQRPFITTKELGLLTLELTALSSALLGCSRIQQPTQPLPSTETPIPPTDTTSQVKETTLPTQISTSLPPTQLPPPTPVETAQPAPPSQEEQPPTLETCKTTVEEVLAKYSNNISEMEGLVNERVDSGFSFQYETDVGYRYDLLTNEKNFITDPYCIPTTSGETLAVARLSAIGYYQKDGEVVPILVPVVQQVEGGAIFYGNYYLAGADEDYIQLAINNILNSIMPDSSNTTLPPPQRWEETIVLSLMMPRDFASYIAKYFGKGEDAKPFSDFYSAYYEGKEDVLAGDISKEDLLLPIQLH